MREREIKVEKHSTLIAFDTFDSSIDAGISVIALE